MELQGKNVVVTGAGRGIGEALARAFHAEGARLVIADLQGADAVAATLDGVVGIAADVSTEAGNKALVEAATEVLGPIDLFFANAGVGNGHGVVETDENAWDTSFAVNVNAHRWAAKYLLPDVARARRGLLLLDGVGGRPADPDRFGPVHGEQAGRRGLRRVHGDHVRRPGHQGHVPVPAGREHGDAPRRRRFVLRAATS